MEGRRYAGSSSAATSCSRGLVGQGTGTDHGAAMRCSECNAEMKYDQPDGLCDSCSDADEIGRLMVSLEAERFSGAAMHASAIRACADLLRLVAPDDVDGDYVPREAVVEIAMRLKRSVDAAAKRSKR